MNEMINIGNVPKNPFKAWKFLKLLKGKVGWITRIFLVVKNIFIPIQINIEKELADSFLKTKEEIKDENRNL